jgi:hypothetical protein
MKPQPKIYPRRARKTRKEKEEGKIEKAGKIRWFNLISWD